MEFIRSIKIGKEQKSVLIFHLGGYMRFKIILFVNKIIYEFGFISSSQTDKFSF